MYKILFVCTGNTCRSPMAEAWFRHLAEIDHVEVEVSSAGVIAGDGVPAQSGARQAVEEAGLTLSGFRSRELTLPRIREADRIIGMTAEHVDQVCRLAPDAKGRTSLLMQAVNSNVDIEDPQGMGVAAFRACLSKMRPPLRSLLDQVKQEIKKKDSQAMGEIIDFVDREFKIIIGSDHGGYELKNALVDHLKSKGIEVTDAGPFSFDAQDDYPDFAGQVGRKVATDPDYAGILICRSGIGMSINANRFRKVRAALVKTPKEAAVSRSHNCSNVLVIGGNDLNEVKLAELADTWVQTPFSKEERHARRLNKIEENSTDDAAHLRDVDGEVAELIEKESKRQEDIIDLIASENLVSAAVRSAAGTCLTNKYACGYPGNRIYSGCEHVDAIEQLAIDRACKLFGAEAANVQPYSGSQANMAAYFALLEPGDTVLAMHCSHGGHTTHGDKDNFSGRLFNFVHYKLAEETELLDYDEIARMAEEHKPRLIVAGSYAYSRTIDFPRLRQIADSVDAFLMVDMAHIAGLVAAGVHPSPVPHADVVTTSTHKTLRGPRGGLILCRKDLVGDVNAQISPGIQGGPLMQIVAAKAVCFHEAMTNEFKNYAKQVVSNARTLAGALSDRGFRIISGATENHMMVLDLQPMNVTGKAAERALEAAGIAADMVLTPYDRAKPTVTSGIRLGTPAVTARGMKETEMAQIADWIGRVVGNVLDTQLQESVKQEVLALTAKFPVP